MKIALLDPALFTWPYDKALLDGLEAAGYQVNLYTKHMQVGEPGQGDARCISHFYPGLHTKLAEKLPRQLFLALKGLLHILGMAGLVLKLNKNKPDIIHVQWAPLPVVDKLFIPLLRKIAPVVFTVHDSSPFNNNPGSGLQRIGATEIFALYDSLIVHTEHARQKLQSYGVAEDKLTLIPHGPLDVQVRADQASALPLRTDGKVRVLLFGKLKPYKGCDLLIQAIGALALELRRKIEFRVVGKAEMDVAPLKQLAAELGIAEQIIWDLRFVSVEEKPGIYAAADIIAMPYRAIDASGVFMEAVMIGRPILASRIGLFAETLQEDVHGALAASENVPELTSALAKLASSAEGRAMMAENVRKLGASIPSWAEIGQRTSALYGKLLSAKKL
jgi:glycosyltransferase involved in cell wall biosynthesis